MPRHRIEPGPPHPGHLSQARFGGLFCCPFDNHPAGSARYAMDKRLSPSKRGYDRTWQKLRKMILAQEPLCRMCKGRGKTSPASVVDHIKPIKDAPELRLVVSNLQSLCKTCHDSTKQSYERTGYMRGATVDGIPTDPSHHWSK